jgi:ribosome-associated protein
MSQSPSAPEEITIGAEPIELSRLLKFAGVFESGGEAKHAVHGGQVTVNGVVETAARKQIFAGAKVVCAGRTLIVKL